MMENELRAAFDRYARHDQSCGSGLTGRCNCGLTETRKALTASHASNEEVHGCRCSYGPHADAPAKVETGA